MRQDAELKQLAAELVERCRTLGADEAEVSIGRGRSSSVEVRGGRIEELGGHDARGASFVVWKGTRLASVSTNDLTMETVDAVIRDALALAEYSDPMPELALPDSAWLATEFPDVVPWDPTICEVGETRMIDIARDVEAFAMGFDPRIHVSGGASCSLGWSSTAVATTRRAPICHSTTFASYGVSVVADDEGGKKRRGAWSTWARHWDLLRPIEEVGRRAGSECVRRLGSTKGPTGRLPVVFEREIAAEFALLLFSSLDGNGIEQGASWLCDRLGQTVGSPHVTLVNDPLIPRRSGSVACDGEGLPAVRTAFVEGGVLRTYAHTTYTARRLRQAPTGHAAWGRRGRPWVMANNLFLLPGDRSAESLWSELPRGFYCTGMMGSGVNVASGDFSQGAEGFLIEDGKLTRPIGELTLSARIPEIFERIDGVANDLPGESMVEAPTLRVSEMTLAGN